MGKKQFRILEITYFVSLFFTNALFSLQVAGLMPQNQMETVRYMS